MKRGVCKGVVPSQSECIFDTEFNTPVFFVEELRELFSLGDKPSLFILLDRTAATFDCADSRDKVYALLGLESSSHHIKPDYNASVQNLFIDVAHTLVASPESLGIFGAINPDNIQGRLPGLPSWVPDWTNCQYPERLDADGQFRACKYDWSSNSSGARFPRLPVHGKVIDVVESMSHEAASAFADHEKRRQAQIQLLLLYSKVASRLGAPENLLSLRVVGLVVRTLVAGHIHEVDSFEITDKWASVIWKSLMHFAFLNETPDEATKAHSSSFWERVSFRYHRRTIIWPKKHALALGPEHVKRGDVICILHGSTVPVILRPQGNYWTVVGQCYMDGVMFGEAVTWTEDEADVFELV